jgi:phosphate transport system substrate-binding protein
MPMKPDDLAKLGMGQLPRVIGGVAPIINLENVQPGQMRFNGPLLADIFLGKIKAWKVPGQPPAGRRAAPLSRARR